jgi:DNA-binding transcriptional regulator YiaG
LKISTDISAAEIGLAIKRLRVRLQMTQKQFARIINPEFESRTVQRWEAGTSIPAGDCVIKMLQAWPVEFLAEFSVEIEKLGAVDLNYPTQKETARKGLDKVNLQAFRQLRERLEQTQRGMADLLNMSPSGWEHWEYGRRQPTGIAIKALRDMCPDEETRALFGIANGVAA